MKYDRRKSIRQLIYKNVKLVHASFGTSYTYTRDISEDGVFLARKDLPDIPKGTVVKMQITEAGNAEIIFNMKVAHVSEHGIGMAFIDYEYRGVRYDIENLDEHFVNRNV